MKEIEMRRFLTTMSAVALALMASTLPGRSEDIAKANSTIQLADAKEAAKATAPEFTGLGNWFNSPPLTLSGLRGKVVLVNFWTYGCVNCVNTLPHVTQLHAKYKDKGLVIVGIHTPEFPFEHSSSNVQAALKRHGITYPVAQDNRSATWNAWRNQYWPAQYIVDRTGKIVYSHAGEGAYDEIDRTIDRLLNASS
jgi:thiol-disulfide isomerase/thioredoxin